MLVALSRAGYLKHWVQQNHDGLPQKAGYPQEHINEIHGAWFDPRYIASPKFTRNVRLYLSCTTIYTLTIHNMSTTILLFSFFMHST